MTAAQTAQRLGLDEKAVAAFSGSKAEFAQHFGVAESEAPAPAAPPSAPTGVAATVVDATHVNVAFAALPADATEITVVSAPAITLTYSNIDFTSPVSVQGAFAQGVAYTFQMRVANAAGNSPLSASSAAVTPNP